MGNTPGAFQGGEYLIGVGSVYPQTHLMYKSCNWEDVFRGKTKKQHEMHLHREICYFEGYVVIALS